MAQLQTNNGTPPAPPVKPPRKVLSPSIPTRKTSVPQRSNSQNAFGQIFAGGNGGAGTPGGPSATTTAASRETAFAPTHARKTSDTSSLARSWIDPEGAIFDSLDGVSSSNRNSALSLSPDKPQAAPALPAPGLGISGLTSPIAPNVVDDAATKQHAQSGEAKPTPTSGNNTASHPASGAVTSNHQSPAVMSLQTVSEDKDSNYSPFTPPSTRGVSSFSNASPGGRRKSKPDNLTISPVITSTPSGGSAGTNVSAPSPFMKGLASPTARGRTPPPTNPPTEPLPPLPSSASLVASTWSKRLSDEERSGRMNRGITSPSSASSANLAFSAASPASSHPYAALRNIPPTSLALQQAMGVSNPPSVRSTRFSDPSNSTAVASKDAKLAVANNHLETLAGAHSAEAVLKAVQPEATFDEQKQQQQRESRPANLSRKSDPEASRPKLDDTAQLAAPGSAPSAAPTRTEDAALRGGDEEEDGSEADSDAESVQEVAVVRTGTLVSPLRNRSNDTAGSSVDTIRNTRAQLIRSSVNNAGIMRRPGTGESPKDGVGGGSFFISGSSRSVPQDWTDAHMSGEIEAPARVSIGNSERRPVVVERSHSQQSSLVADPASVGASTQASSEAPTPTLSEAGLASPKETSGGGSTLHGAEPSQSGHHPAIRESTIDPLHIDGGSRNARATSHAHNESVETSTSAPSRPGKNPDRRPSQTLRNSATSANLDASGYSRSAHTAATGSSPSPALANNAKFSSAFGEIAVAFRQLQAEKRTLEKVIRATTPLDGFGDGGEDFVRYLTTMQSKLELSSSEIRKLLDLLERQRAVMDFMLDTHQAELDAHLDEIDDLSDELDEAIQSIETLKAANTASQEALDTSRTEALSAREESAKLRATLAERDKAAEVHDAVKTELDGLRKERGEWVTEKSSNHERIKSLDETNTAHSSRVAVLEAELASLAKTHEEKLSSQSADHEREIWNLKEEHEQILADHNAEIEKAADQLAAHHGRALEELQSEHSQTIDELQARIAAMESSQEAALSARRQMLDTIDAKDEHIAQLSYDLEQMQREDEDEDGESEYSQSPSVEAAREEERQKHLAIREEEAKKAAEVEAERDDMKRRLQEQEAEMERLRLLVAERASSSHSRSDSNSLSIDRLPKDDAVASDSQVESDDSLLQRRQPSSSISGVPSTPGNSGDDAGPATTPISSSGMGSAMHVSPVTPIHLPSGTPTEQVRQLMAQLTEQRKRETHIRSAYKQLRDDHRRLQNSHKEMADRRRGSIGNFNLLAGPGSAAGHGNSSAPPSSYVVPNTPPYMGSVDNGLSHIAASTGNGNASSGGSGSPQTSRALKRLSLPLTSNMAANGANGGNGQPGGFPDHVLAALATPGASHRSSIGPQSGKSDAFVGLASFAHPPGSYRGPAGNGNGSSGTNMIPSSPSAGSPWIDAPGSGSGGSGGGGYFLARPRLSRPSTADASSISANTSGTVRGDGEEEGEELTADAHATHTSSSDEGVISQADKHSNGKADAEEEQEELLKSPPASAAVSEGRVEGTLL